MSISFSVVASVFFTPGLYRVRKETVYNFFYREVNNCQESSLTNSLGGKLSYQFINSKTDATPVT
jgi:hypothetical protein